MRSSAFALLSAASSFLACDGEPECVEDLDLDCRPLYEPRFDEIFDRTLKPTCGQPGSFCHASAGGQGGLVFEDRERAFALLTGAREPPGPTARVVAGDPACSLLIQRLEAKDPRQAMPPGQPLSEAERCGLRLWVLNGASR